MNHETWKVFETTDNDEKPNGFAVGPDWFDIVAHRIETKEDADLIASAPTFRAMVKDCSARLLEIRDVVRLAANTPISDAILEILNRPQPSRHPGTLSVPISAPVRNPSWTGDPMPE